MITVSCGIQAEKLELTLTLEAQSAIEIYTRHTLNLLTDHGTPNDLREMRKAAVTFVGALLFANPQTFNHVQRVHSALGVALDTEEF